MKNIMKAAIAALALTGTVSVAQAQIVSGAPGTTYNTSFVNQTSTGQSMAGMQVTVCMSAGGCSTNSWGNLDGTYYGVSSSAYRIRVGKTEDTFFGDWGFDLFSSADLVSVTFNGKGGNTIFDRTLPFFGTPGSSVGLDANLINKCFTPSGGGTNNCVNFDHMKVTYSNQVTFNNVFYGDEYEQVAFDFTGVGLTGPAAGGGFDEDFSTDCPGRRGSQCAASGFYLHMDTDKATLTTTAPEPSTYVLMFAGMASIGLAARRRRRSV